MALVRDIPIYKLEGSCPYTDSGQCAANVPESCICAKEAPRYIEEDELRRKLGRLRWRS